MFIYLYSVINKIESTGPESQNHLLNPEIEKGISDLEILLEMLLKAFLVCQVAWGSTLRYNDTAIEYPSGMSVVVRTLQKIGGRVRFKSNNIRIFN